MQLLSGTALQGCYQEASKAGPLEGGFGLEKRGSGDQPHHLEQPDFRVSLGATGWRGELFEIAKTNRAAPNGTLRVSRPQLHIIISFATSSAYCKDVRLRR